MNKAAEIGWLAGLMDGEGTISLNIGMDHLRSHYHLCVALSNTSVAVIEKVQKILSSLDVDYKTYTASKKGRAWKDIHQVKVIRIDSIKSLLKILAPHLTSKKQQALLMLELLKERRSDKRKAYTEECIRLADAIRALNRRGSVETVRESSERMKIQSDLVGDHESVAEMPTPKPN